MTQNSAPDNRSHQKNKLYVQIALDLQAEYPKQDCPSDDTLAAFAEGRLDAGQRQNIMEHLDSCDTCYRLWFDITTFLHGGPSKHKPYSNPRYWGVGGIAVAALAISLIIIIELQQFTPLDSARLLTDAYDQLLSSAPSISNETLDRVVPLPWEQAHPAYAMGPSHPHSPANLAFGAGLWNGRALFSGQSATEMPVFLTSAALSEKNAAGWTQTAFASFYHLGRWCVLIKMACGQTIPNLPETFWKEQLDIITPLKKALLSKTDKADIVHVTPQIDRIANSIRDLKRAVHRNRSCRQLDNDVSRLIELLSPTIPPG